MLKNALLAVVLAAVTTTNTSNSYTGNGSQDTFTFTFKALTSTDVVVSVSGAPVSAVVTLNANQDTTPGGTAVTALPPAYGAAVKVYRSTPRTQTQTYTPYSKFSGTSHERALDKLTLITQEVNPPTEVVPGTPSGAEGTIQTNGGGGTFAPYAGATCTAGQYVSAVSASGAVTCATPAGGSGTFVNARTDCGAVGDGTTDDTAAIQACLNANPGRTVLLPFTTGGYRITSPITITRQKLVGEGSARSRSTAGASRLVKNSTDCSMVVLDSSSTLENLTVENQSAATSSGSAIRVIGHAVRIYGVMVGTLAGGTLYEGIRVGTSVQLVLTSIHNVEVLGAKSAGIIFDGSAGFINDVDISHVLVDNSLSSPRGDGLVMTGRVEAVQVTNAHFISVARGLWLTSASYVNNGIPDYFAWNNIIIDTCTAECVLIHRASFVNFTDTYVSNSSTYNVRIQQAERIKFSGGTIIQSGGPGIYLDNSVAAGYPKYVTISDVAVTNNTTYGIDITPNTTNFLIRGNTFSDTNFPNAGNNGQSTAVRVQTGTSDRYIIADNLIDGTTVTDNGSGANKRVANNY